MAQIKDFDAMFAEMHQETIPFRIYGKIYQIKKAIPAAIVLELSRQEKSAAMSTELLVRAARIIFGEKQLNQIVNHQGFSLDQLGVMVQWAFSAINGTDKPEPEAITEDDVSAGPEKN